MVVLVSDPPPASGTILAGEKTLLETLPAEDMAAGSGDKITAWNKEREREREVMMWGEGIRFAHLGP